MRIGERTYDLTGKRMSPQSTTTVPFAEPSFGYVYTKAPGHWSHLPASSENPNWQLDWNSPVDSDKSVPASETTRMLEAFASRRRAAVQRRLSSCVGNIRARISGGSTVTRVRSPSLSKFKRRKSCEKARSSRRL